MKEGIAWLNPSVPYPLLATPAFNATFGAVSLPTLLNGTTYTVTVPVSNSGVATWNATGANLVDLSYHWTDATGAVVVWDGTRTPLTADVPPSASTSIAASITTPSTPGAYTLTVDLVREGVAWFGSLGGLPLKLPAQVSAALYAATYSISATTAVLLGESRTVAVTLPKAELDKPGVHIGAKVSYTGRLDSYENGEPPFPPGSRVARGRGAVSGAR